MHAMQSAQPAVANAAIRTCAPRTRNEKRNQTNLYVFFCFSRIFHGLFIRVPPVLSTAGIDVKERLANPFGDIIELGIGRPVGVPVSEDNFSAEGAIEYKPPSFGRETNLKEITKDLTRFKTLIWLASAERDQAGKPDTAYSTRLYLKTALLKSSETQAVALGGSSTSCFRPRRSRISHIGIVPQKVDEKTRKNEGQGDAPFGMPPLLGGGGHPPSRSRIQANDQKNGISTEPKKQKEEFSDI